ncbi:hypothetical protein KQ313_05165 [Synechococcus sp. CS-1325]|uniref:hypothetical protein n=1 Tax=unclassified Synechococcus TaxID=2626047 RepID=UPI0021A7D1A7|nr:MULTISPECIES: hypothetical protein [unclassified Synechococcus]MCT0199065.1 hypothetical protein [Synechococcus sp. CS-1325]MCT0212535.1 hypothetical protein [Synechococcus sp. CS-1326]MCT0232051.1 hypothetical protein [Synechococcus sp. CS-1327]
MSRATAAVLLGRKWSFSQVDDLLHGGPGFLVTLGLIGTFVGLIGNMSELSSLIRGSESAVEQTSLMDGLANLFPSLAAAFSTSLMGVTLSSFLWLIGTANGILGIKNDTIELLAGYLEQVIQTDCRRYSLVGESMERMEIYLTDYLSQFSEKVSRAIENAIASRIEKLVYSLSTQINETKQFVIQVKEGSEKLGYAGELYLRAAKQFEQTKFAQDFSEACEKFLQHTEALRSAANNLSLTARQSVDASELLGGIILKTSDSQGKFLDAVESADKRTELLSVLGTQSNEILSSATASMENVQKKGLTWLSARAKTDRALVKLTGEMSDAIQLIGGIARTLSNEQAADIKSLHGNLGELFQAVESLSSISRLQLASLSEVQAELARIASGIERNPPPPPPSFADRS